MTQCFAGTKILIASANKGKIKEIATLLSNYPVEVVGLDQFNIESPEETGLTFAENAALKAEYYGKKTGLPALADDSGLAVTALGGSPGVKSARYAEEHGGYPQAMEQLKHDISESRTGNYDAAFICALALWLPTGQIDVFEGKIEGSLSFPPRGNHGFGYDPIFVPNNYKVTFAEMMPEEKHSISHRAKAFEKFIEACF